MTKPKLSSREHLDRAAKAAGAVERLAWELLHAMAEDKPNLADIKAKAAMMADEAAKVARRAGRA